MIRRVTLKMTFVRRVQLIPLRLPLVGVVDSQNHRLAGGESQLLFFRQSNIGSRRIGMLQIGLHNEAVGKFVCDLFKEDLFKLKFYSVKTSS